MVITKVIPLLLLTHLALGQASEALPFSESVDNQDKQPFIDDATLDVVAGILIRDRKRSNIDDNGHESSKEINLKHGSSYLSLNFKSGYLDDWLGLDFKVYGTKDSWQQGSPDHEMNFWNVNNPYDLKPLNNTECAGTWSSTCNREGIAIQTAALKLKFDHDITARLGLFSPSVPSALGVNWSFEQGTYLGGEIGMTLDKLKLGFVLADSYRAPWFEHSYQFRDGDNNKAGRAYSIGAHYKFDNKLLLDVAYAGLTDSDRFNSHIKLTYNSKDNWHLGAQLYFVHDNAQYDDNAYQLAFTSSKSTGQYQFRAEAIHSEAKTTETNGSVASFSYRLTRVYGGSAGSYGLWWNNRSDFNHHQETAFFASVERNFSDFNLKGLSIGLSGAYGFGAQSEQVGIDELVEYSTSAFAKYTIQSGPFKSSYINLHISRFVNQSNAKNWSSYTNGFQDETDIKLIVVMPFNIF